MSKISKLYGLGLLLLITPIALISDVPETLVGYWQLDVVKTITDQIEQKLDTSSDTINAVTKREIMERLTKDVDQSSPEIFVTFTEDEMIIEIQGAVVKSESYIVTGGYDNKLMITTSDTKGMETYSTVILIDDGLIFEGTNCETYPDQCEREPKEIGSGNIDENSDFAIAVETRQSNGSSHSLADSRNKEIQRSYYKKVQRKEN